MINAIGGYFSLELPMLEEFHKNGIRLNSGRNCLEYILLSRNYIKIYIPYYTCDAIIETIQKIDVKYEFYHVNIQLEISERINLFPDEALLYTNYFGLKQLYVEKLAIEFGNQLIIDNTQAFFDMPIEKVDTFNSCRKFFGVPDGAYLFTEVVLKENMKEAVSHNRMTSLLERIDLSPEDGFSDYQREEGLFSNMPLYRMSKLTRRLMQSIDYEKVVSRRKINYNILCTALEDTNIIRLPKEKEAVPMVYPYFCQKRNLRQYLIDNRVYVACYWQSVLHRINIYDVEYSLVNDITPLPIDQRYSEIDMYRIVELIKAFVNDGA